MTDKMTDDEKFCLAIDLIDSMSLDVWRGATLQSHIHDARVRYWKELEKANEQNNNKTG